MPSTPSGISRTGALRILLVEDSELLAERMRELLGQITDVEVVGTVVDEDDAVAMTRDRDVHVLILDLQLKHGTGFGVLRTLGEHRPATIVFTNYALPEYRRWAEKFGVEYFLNKSLDFERLPEVIRTLKKVPHS
ncbi:MAG TPA: response regulator transcription factor [Steroidobacteraceae bacterium]|jgi:DNA-binding NarL/FixJ family response regulator|nr:response regulator transcription factor [Steroidobacteraceae bacterium]